MRTVFFLQRKLLLVFIMLYLFGGIAMGGTSMSEVDGNVWYRERIMLPPGAEVHVVLEDAAKMDVKADLIAETRFTPQGGPPWDFTMPYDPEDINDRGRYALRARIEVNGKLIFTSTEHIPAFKGKPGEAVSILVSPISRTEAEPTGSSSVPDASLTDTYWKLTEINGEPAVPGADQKELHLILSGENNRIKGFSGCNRFTGGYTINGDELQLSQMATTMMACVDSMDQEQRFLSALGDTNRYKISGNYLSLIGSSDETLLSFEAIFLK
jgi:putative lipoprotein